MTINLLDEVEAILAADCKIASKYIDSFGNTCAIGALALVAGVDRRTLGMAGSMGIDAGYSHQITGIRDAIASRFKLTRGEMQALQRANDLDNDDEPEERRETDDEMAARRRARVLIAFNEIKAARDITAAG